MYAGVPKSTAGTLLGAVVVVLGVWGQVPAATLLWWLAGIVGVSAWRARLYFRFRRAGLADSDVDRWAAHWTFGSALFGIIWGSTALFMFIPQHPEYQALVLAALYAICTAATPLLARYLPAFYWFVFPTLAPMSVRLALEGESVTTFLAILTALVVYGLIVFGREFNQTLGLALARNYENEDLVEELRVQTAEAEQARQEADTANVSKTRFLAAASHDLRQPLHALGLFSAALRHKVREGEAASIADKIGDSVEALENQFTALLDISKLDAGVVKASPVEFSVSESFDRIERAYSPTAAEKGLQLRVRAGRKVAFSDPVLVERILGNLVMNAIRYTQHGGVLVVCRRRGRYLRLEVRDTGIGIAPDQQVRVFDEFYQVGNVERDRRKGLGLGLATVKRLARLLDSEIELRSWPGRGSIFAFQVPAGERRDDPAEQPLTGQIQTPATAGVDLLVVAIDDEPDIRQALCVLLTQWGCDVIAGEDAEEVLNRLPEFDRYPDLILADYRLREGRTGLTEIAKIRCDIGVEVPAWLVTGTTTPQDLELIARSGFPLLYKPLTAARLREVLVAAKRDGAGNA